MNKKTVQKYIETGEVPEEDFALLTNTEEIVRMNSEDFGETYWAIILDETHFVFCNNVLQFFPTRTLAKVGIYSERICNTKLTRDYQNKIQEKSNA